MRSKEFTNKDGKEQFIDMFQKFLPLCMEILDLDSLPQFIFVSELKQDVQPSFGQYSADRKTLTIALTNRHPNDILRTMAHELTHYKQDTMGRIEADSGRTGSPIENEAHAMAGIVMRNFNKQFPQYLHSKPLTEKWTKKYKSSINCSNPKGFSQRAHCQGRKKNEGIEANLNTKYSLKNMFGDVKSLDNLSLEQLNKAMDGHVTIVGRKFRGQEGNSFRYDVKLANGDWYIMHVVYVHGLIDAWLTDEENNKIPLSKFKAGSMAENFADGRNPQDKGDAKRHGINTKASVSSLRKTAKQGGRKGQLAHWLANMKAGRAKKK